ncbi:Crp/Fnr family transcriptional regulator [Flavobacterium sp.]|uniref:Crp/Fnr family transcriptional regulator n=1 Tax=Flavobacterium sp. TaxID=239 RepID=UPI00286D732B|nr:Crp/Fnr family transcriptional regulator [Flavobacterium sp.]
MPIQIINNIKSFVALSQEDEEAFIKILEIKKYAKKEFILQEGQVCDKIFFINSGISRVFFNIDGEEKIVQFFFSDSWFTDYSSFLIGQPTNENLQAMEPCEVVHLKKNDLYKLYETNPVFERVGRVMAENAFMSLMQLNSMRTNLEPEDRYLNLLKQRPELVERIPQHYIASYLGIKPQSLSRIRKRIFDKK